MGGVQCIALFSSWRDWRGQCIVLFCLGKIGKDRYIALFCSGEDLRGPIYCLVLCERRGPLYCLVLFTERLVGSKICLVLFRRRFERTNALPCFVRNRNDHLLSCFVFCSIITGPVASQMATPGCGGYSLS